MQGGSKSKEIESRQVRYPQTGKMKTDFPSKDSKSETGEPRHKERSSEIVKRLLSGEGKPSPDGTTPSMKLGDGEDEVWSGVESKRRPGSGRLTGLRRELLTAGGRRHWSEGEGQAETTEAGPRCRSVGSQLTRSGRTSGLRGEMMSAHGRTSVDSHAAFKSGRTTGVRGELTLQDDSLSEESRHPPLPHGGGGGANEGRGPRLHTAVLAKGHRPLLLGASGSDSCLLPEITLGPDTEARESTHELVKEKADDLDWNPLAVLIVANSHFPANFQFVTLPNQTM